MLNFTNQPTEPTMSEPAAAAPAADPTPAATPAAPADPTPAAPQQAQPEPISPSPFSGALKDDGSFADGWIDRLPSEFDPYRATLANYRNLETLAGALVESKRAAMEKSQGVKPPGAESTPEEIAAFRKAMGVPDSPDGYGIAAPENLPEGVEWDEQLAGDFAATAHELGLNPDQAKKLSDWYTQQMAESVNGQFSQREQAMEAEREKLKQAFGAKFDARMNAAKRAALTLGLDPETNPAFNNAETVQAMARLADMLGEDQIVGGDAPGRLSPAAQAKDIMTNPGNPQYARYQSGDAEVVAHVNALMKRAYGG